MDMWLLDLASMSCFHSLIVTSMECGLRTALLIRYVRDRILIKLFMRSTITIILHCIIGLSKWIWFVQAVKRLDTSAVLTLSAGSAQS